MKSYLMLMILLLAACGSDTLPTESEEAQALAADSADVILADSDQGELVLNVEAAALAGTSLEETSFVSAAELDQLAAEDVDIAAVRFFDLTGETVMMSKKKKCPYSDVCPFPSSGYTFMYWYDASHGPGVVNCYYRLSSYPYTVTITGISTNGCKDCCPGALPCSVGPHYSMSFTCHNN